MGFFDRLKFVVDAPMNNDVSTTPDDPPEFRACKELPANRGRSLRWNGKADALIDDAPLEPLSFDVSTERAFDSVVELAKGYSNWTIIATDRERGRLEAVSTTELLKFKDDVVVEVRGNQVHMRSKSRLGRKDFGKNEARIRGFLAALRAMLVSESDDS